MPVSYYAELWQRHIYQRPGRQPPLQVTGSRAVSRTCSLLAPPRVCPYACLQPRQGKEETDPLCRPYMLGPAQLTGPASGRHTPVGCLLYATIVQLSCPRCPCCSTSYIECLNGTSGKWAVREGMLGNISTPDGTYVPAVYNAFSTPGGELPTSHPLLPQSWVRKMTTRSCVQLVGSLGSGMFECRQTNTRSQVSQQS